MAFLFQSHAQHYFDFTHPSFMSNENQIHIRKLPEINQSNPVLKVGNTFVVAESPNKNDRGIFSWIYYNLNYYTIHFTLLLV